MSSEGYRRALQALQFFCLEGDRQYESVKNSKVNPPVFFKDAKPEDIGCDYLLGVACVFVTYKSYLYDRFASEQEATKLDDFSHRLSVFMHQGSAAEWSVYAVRQSEVWGRLRAEALAILNQLGEEVPNDVPDFNIEILIDPDEFRVSDEAKSILD